MTAFHLKANPSSMTAFHLKANPSSMTAFRLKANPSSMTAFRLKANPRQASLQKRSIFTERNLTEISQFGDLKSLGLCNFTPPGFAEYVLEAVYINTHLPWFATIAATTILIRVVCFPIMVKVQRASAIIQNLKPKSDPLTAEIKKLREEGDMPMATQKTRDLQALFKANNVSPLTPVLGLIQMPIFVSFFMAIQSMSNLPVPGFDTGGALWFTNLAIADPYYILPVLAGAGFVAVMQAGSEMGGGAQMAVVKPIMYCVAVFSIPFTATFPAAVFIYWVVSNSFTLLQVNLFKNPKVRDYLGISQIANTAVKPPSPYKKISYYKASKIIFGQRYGRKIESSIPNVISK